jgi:hypothetical protein
VQTSGSPTRGARGHRGRRSASTRDLLLASRAPAKEIDHMLQDGEASIRNTHRAIGDAGNISALEADQVMVVPRGTEDIPSHPVRLGKRPAESRREQGREQTVYCRPPGAHSCALRSDTELLGSKPAS